MLRTAVMYYDVLYLLCCTAEIFKNNFSFFSLPFLFFCSYYVPTSCTTRSLWDLWWFGNTSQNMAPYRTHTALDYRPKKYLSYLSRARKVIEKIESLLTAKYENLNLSRMNITDGRAKFAIGFHELCVWLSPELSIVELDSRHYGDAMYLSFYDRILKKRKRAAIENSSVV